MAFVTYETHPALSMEQKRKEFKLRFICDRMKLEPQTLTIDECIHLAIEAGDTAKAVGPFDIAFESFSNHERAYYQLAEHLLDREKYIHLVTAVPA